MAHFDDRDTFRGEPTSFGYRALSEPERSALGTTRMIALGLLMGSAIYIGIALMQSPTSPLTNALHTTMRLVWFTVLVSVVLVHPIIRSSIMRPMTQMRDSLGDEAFEGDEGLRMVAHAFTVNTIIGCALAEAMSLLGTTLYLLNGDPLDLLMGAAPLLAFVVFMPSTDRWLRFYQRVTNSAPGPGAGAGPAPGPSSTSPGPDQTGYS